jgi:hypothetical protein
MNWEAVGALAEAIGVIAIFVSLVYVAMQIRQNTEQFARSIESDRLSAFERNVESGNQFRELLILHPELLQLLLTGCKSYNNLEELDQARYSLLLRNMFASIQGSYIRQLSMGHDPTGFEGVTGIIDRYLLHLGVREWLAVSDPDWRPAFREFVELRLEVVKQRIDGDTSPEGAVSDAGEIE